MGLIFRKSFKIAPGVRLNIGKKSAGISCGSKFGGISYNSRTGLRTRVSAPGTGLSYTSKVGAAKNASLQSEEEDFSENLKAQAQTQPSATQKKPRKKKKSAQMAELDAKMRGYFIKIAVLTIGLVCLFAYYGIK